MSGIREDIQSTLASSKGRDLSLVVKDLLLILGYESDRTFKLSGSVEDFIQKFPAIRPNTEPEGAFREDVQSVKLVFQMTNDQIISSCLQGSGRSAGYYQGGRHRSFLFLAVELKGPDAPRGILDEFTREIDKRLTPPTVVFFRAGTRLSVAVVGRRPNKLDNSRDVFERVTSLIRDISLPNPSPIDLDSLMEISLSQCANWMVANHKPINCDGILNSWLSKLTSSERNRKFYNRIYSWFEKAIFEKKFRMGKKTFCGSFLRTLWAQPLYPVNARWNCHPELNAGISRRGMN